MNIGDKVRLVHGREEGIIYAFLPGNVVEVEIEDGFRIPVLRNELVTISPVESQRLGKTAQGIQPRKESDHVFKAPAPFAEKGVYLAFVAVNDRAVTVHLINNSDWMLPFTATSFDGKTHQGLAAGALQARSSQKLSEFQMKDFEAWPVFEFNFLFYREGHYELPLPMNKKMKCRAQSFYKSKRRAPLLDKDAYVFQLDQEGLKQAEPQPVEGLSERLREKMMGGETVENEPLETPTDVIDLHIEKLSPADSGISKDQILTKQLAAFESCLERAIAGGMSEITFIHGVGSGALRDEIHRRLSKNKEINYFKDAQKEKFGYGATLVKIK
ncbi:Smr domain-containing protein [Dyadobacter jejuensis]|uniref:Smr domain-containing protein n=1 Tax=Dyadobacter jejuensis TaxID=1082580 RepID=A0A316ALR0_9BACT|nr:DUF2027 domain-containing protein [Dyadobacter jejuensis]PWJ58189.1 Smr domain-containing protein [Dyadobacter jejuensis]